MALANAIRNAFSCEPPRFTLSRVGDANAVTIAAMSEGVVTGETIGANCWVMHVGVDRRYDLIAADAAGPAQVGDCRKSGVHGALIIS